VLDVFKNEPDIDLDLLTKITLGTPHIAGYSLDGKANGTSMAIQALSGFFNLGIDNWKPETIPLPEHKELLADPSQEEILDLFWKIYRQTYDVSIDDQRLQNDPGSFERLRGDYPFRREPEAYAVRLFQGYPELSAQLEGLGFSVLADYCA
jgi:erythronate-4-phosphate dehydrogenase